MQFCSSVDGFGARTDAGQFTAEVVFVRVVPVGKLGEGGVAVLAEDVEFAMGVDLEFIVEKEIQFLFY